MALINIYYSGDRIKIMITPRAQKTKKKEIKNVTTKMEEIRIENKKRIDTKIMAEISRNFSQQRYERERLMACAPTKKSL